MAGATGRGNGDRSLERSPVTDQRLDPQSGPERETIVARFLLRLLPMIEPLLCGIVLGLIPVTLVGLFVAAWNQYRRGGALG